MSGSTAVALAWSIALIPPRVSSRTLGFCGPRKPRPTIACLSAPDCGLFFKARRRRRLSAEVQDQLYLPKVIAGLRRYRIAQRRKIIRTRWIVGPTPGTEKLACRHTAN